MKKAFMRGVCALNLEAMTIFNKDDQKGKFMIRLISIKNKFLKRINSSFIFL